MDVFKKDEPCHIQLANFRSILEKMFISNAISHPEFNGDSFTYHEGNEQYTPTFSFLFLTMLRYNSNMSSEQWANIESNFRMVCGNDYSHENWQKNKVKLFELIENSRSSRSKKNFVNQVLRNPTEENNPEHIEFENLSVAQQSDQEQEDEIVVNGNIYKLFKKSNFDNRRRSSGFMNGRNSKNSNPNNKFPPKGQNFDNKSSGGNQNSSVRWHHKECRFCSTASNKVFHRGWRCPNYKKSNKNGRGVNAVQPELNDQNLDDFTGDTEESS